MVYRAAWKCDLTTPELDTLAAASSMMQRYQNAYAIKEAVFRALCQRLGSRTAPATEREALKAYLFDYTRAYFTGDFDRVVELIGRMPVADIKE